MPSQNTNRLAPVHAIKKYDMFNSGIPVYAFRSAERLSSAKQWMPRLFVVTQRSLLVARRDKQCMVRRIIPLAELQDVGVEKQRDGSIVFLFRLIDNSQEPDLVVRNLKSLEVASPVEPPAGSPKASLHRPKDIPAYAMDVVDIISACRGEPLLFIPKSEIQPKGLVPLAVLKKPSGYRSPRIRLSDYRFGINESDYGPVDCDSAGGDVAEGDVSFGQLKAAYERFGALQPSSPPSAPASDAEMHSPRVAATVHGSNGSYAFGKFTSLLNPEAGPKSSHEPPASSSAPALRALTQSQSDVRRDVYEVVLRSPDETIGIWFGAEESASSAAPQQRPGVLITHAPRPDSAADRAGFPHHGWVVSVNNHNVADMPELLELMEHMRSDGVLVYRFLVEVPFSTVTAFDDRQPSCRTSPSATPQFRETAFSALRRSTPGITTPNPELKETYINNVSDTATTLNAPQAMSASRQSTLHLPPPQLNRPTERFSPAPSNTSEGIWKKTSRLDVTASGHLAVPATFASQAPATAWQPTVMWQKGSDAGSVESAARAPLTLPPAGPHPAPMLGPSVERQGWLSSMVAPIPGAQPLSFYDVHGLVPAHVLASGGLAQLLQQHPAGVGVYPELFAAVEVLSVEVQQAAGYVAGAPMEIYNSHTPIMTLVPSTKVCPPTLRCPPVKLLQRKCVACGRVLEMENLPCMSSKVGGVASAWTCATIHLAHAHPHSPRRAPSPLAALHRGAALRAVASGRRRRAC
eukprot:TRINITY_DN5243_c0_g1_i4.p1 TRINITY_DN5243_c0_g1~~TRINITY_DN5243_c0_g1_i4.p1  ORF type:complete len:748 (+),score=112.22 TRINITY_DN5243_c0_g1_i4:147-2390(+)